MSDFDLFSCPWSQHNLIEIIFMHIMKTPTESLQKKYFEPISSVENVHILISLENTSQIGRRV